MGSRRSFVSFALVGALPGAAAVLLAGSLSLERAAAVMLISIASSMIIGGWFLQREEARYTRGQAATALQVASGDLTRTPGGEADPSGDLRRLVISLRRAVSQVQRVTQNLRGTCSEVADRSRRLLEFARRQGSAVERTLSAVSSMSNSLDSADDKVKLLQNFAKDATASLQEMTHRMESVGEVLATLNDFVTRQSLAVEEMTERIQAIATSGGELAKFAIEADLFVGAVASGIEVVRRRAGQTGDLAREVSSTAERGQALVADSVKGMYEVQEQVQRVAQLIEGLGQRSDEIGRIIDVIEEIADQTNLLSLNASIIAAQAGEHGRPFAVVADAIRGLAERTARSTREISSLVNTVRTEVSRAVELVGEGRERAAHGVALGDRAQTALVEIRDTVAKTFQAVEETVQETARLQSEGNRVAEASQRVAGRVEEVSRAAFDQVRTGRSLVEQTREMARLAQDASQQAAGQAEVAQHLAGAVNRLDEARSELGRAHETLQQGDADIAGAVAEVRADAGRVIQVADDLSRTVDHLYREAEGLEQEVFRFRLPEARRGGALRVGVPVADCVEASQHFDPQLLTDVNVIDIAANFYSGLLRAGDGASVIPDLAESWEVEPNGHRYRFHLRQGVRFHDGRRLTSNEVKACYERSLAPGRNSPATWIFEDVVGANEYRKGHADSVVGIRCPSDAVLEIELKEPKAFFQNLLALPVTMIGFPNERGIPIGTGPFRVVDVQSGRRIVLERNPEYYIKDRPLVDRQEMLLFPGPDEALKALNDGHVDVVSNIVPNDVERVKLQGMSILSASSLSTHFVAFSLNVKPYDDPRVRQALRLLIDIDAGVRENRPDARPARCLTPPGLPSYDESVAITQVDVPKARELLAAAGFEKGLQVVLYGTVRRGLEGAGFFRHFPEARVELRQELVPNDEFTRRTEAGTMGMFQAGWVADYPDADNFLYFLCHSRAQQSYYNLHYKSDELDRCTEEARSLIDPDRRTELYRRAETIIRRDVPMIPIYHDRTFAAVRPSVHALRLRLTPPQLRTDDVWVDEE